MRFSSSHARIAETHGSGFGKKPQSKTDPPLQLGKEDGHDNVVPYTETWLEAFAF